MIADLAYLIAIHSLNKLGAAKLARLFDFYGYHGEMAWKQPQGWQEAAGLARLQVEELLAARRDCSVEKIYESYLASGAGVITLRDTRYPMLLRQIYAPPPLLFYKGELPTDDDICLAMIGSRRASGYGYQVAETLARDLAAQGLTIVSGMARGIDGICHQHTMLAGGRTVAVLGGGVDIIYPREHKRLYHGIMRQGAVLSEFPLGSPPATFNFPLRNRIISGLSRGVLVIEAGDKSGTLLTVDHGLEQGRDIFAVPGPITSAVSFGTNRLIAQGAKLVQTAEDVWREYLDVPKPVLTAEEKEKRPQLAPEERDLLMQMSLPLHFDQLLALSGWPTNKLAALLTMWEIRGLIRQLPGKNYQRK
ncbi:MAG: DNA-processing protein DprA [Clostridiales bacterium]|nr:DNA-processing protein DprA [Clostridiales bacterium]